MAHAKAKQFDSTLTKIGVYSLGATPPISRLIDGAHWLTDITFSAVLRVFVVDNIDKFLFKTEAYGIKYPKAKSISCNFTLGPNTIGLTGSF